MLVSDQLTITKDEWWLVKPCFATAIFVSQFALKNSGSSTSISFLAHLPSYECIRSCHFHTTKLFKDSQQILFCFHTKESARISGARISQPSCIWQFFEMTCDMGNSFPSAKISSFFFRCREHLILKTGIRIQLYYDCIGVKKAWTSSHEMHAPPRLEWEPAGSSPFRFWFFSAACA